MELKPCPFCGGLPSWITLNGGYSLVCGNPNCFASVRVQDTTEEQAIIKWNTRAESKAEPSAAEPDNVNHPSHYETNGIECIDAMKATQGVSAVQDFCICNAFKYIWRHKHKNGAEDIKKAVWYLTKWLELERWGVKPNEGGVDSRL
jgi:hypothetical protein